MARPEGGTQLVLEHIARVDDKQWAEFGPGAVGVGWDLGLLGLGAHLGLGKTVEPSEAEAWVASAEGKEFITRSSEAWRDASIAFGTDPEIARAAGKGTTAFYTGAPEPSGVG